MAALKHGIWDLETETESRKRKWKQKWKRKQKRKRNPWEKVPSNRFEKKNGHDKKINKQIKELITLAEKTAVWLEE